MKTLLPWSRPGRLWRAACHVNLGLVMGILTFSLTITLLALSVGLLITFFLALPAIWMLFTLSRGFGKARTVEGQRADGRRDRRSDPPAHAAGVARAARRAGPLGAAVA